MPAFPAETFALIAPAGVKALVNEPPASVIGSTAPCQVPWKATVQPLGSRFGVPPVRSMSVCEPLVLYQLWSACRSQ